MPHICHTTNSLDFVHFYFLSLSLFNLDYNILESNGTSLCSWFSQICWNHTGDINLQLFLPLPSRSPLPDILHTTWEKSGGVNEKSTKIFEELLH